MGGARWTRTKDAILRRLAGKVPASQLSAILGKSRHSVEVRASELHVSLICPPGGMFRCPRCGEWRTRVVRGLCPVCQREQTLRRLQRRADALEVELGPSYAEASSKRRQTAKSRPMRPRGGAGMAAFVAWEAETCEWLDRENATIRRRCERMEAKIASRLAEDARHGNLGG